MADIRDPGTTAAPVVLLSLRSTRCNGIGKTYAEVDPAKIVGIRRTPNQPDETRRVSTASDELSEKNRGLRSSNSSPVELPPPDASRRVFLAAAKRPSVTWPTRSTAGVGKSPDYSGFYFIVHRGTAPLRFELMRKRSGAGCEFIAVLDVAAPNKCKRSAQWDFARNFVPVDVFVCPSCQGAGQNPAIVPMCFANLSHNETLPSM